MANEDYEVYKAIREKTGRRSQSADQYEQARHLAAGAGMDLNKVTESRYALNNPRDGWLLNIYPAQLRLYHDRECKRRPPFLKIRPDWTLLDVVQAAVLACAETDDFDRGIASHTPQTAPTKKNRRTPTEDEVRLRAYQLWELAGRPDGDGKEFWQQAEAELGR